MESVKMWVMSIAVGAIAGAVALALSPSDSLGKTVRTTVSVFLISAMLMPLVSKNGFSFDFEISKDDTALSNEIEITDSVAKATAEAIKEKVQNLLEQKGISKAHTDIKMKVNGSEISVESVTVTIPAKYAAQKEMIRSFIKDELQIKAEVTTQSDERRNGDGSENS